jgi:hypothetical protein
MGNGFKVYGGAEFLFNATYVLFSGTIQEIVCERLSAVQRVSSDKAKLKDYPCSNENEARVLEVMLDQFEKRWVHSMEGYAPLNTCFTGGVH